eukprot:347050-Hanusia_phi.AAC.3
MVIIEECVGRDGMLGWREGRIRTRKQYKQAQGGRQVCARRSEHHCTAVCLISSHSFPPVSPTQSVKQARREDPVSSPPSDQPVSMSAAGDQVAQAESFKLRGNELLNQKDFAAAEECYSEAIRLNPAVEAYFTNRSLVRTNLKKFEEAIEDGKAALDLNPSSAKAHGRIGSAAFQAGDYQLSVSSYHSALQIDPANVTYQKGLEAAEAKLKGGFDMNSVSGTASAIDSILSAAASQPSKAQSESVNDSQADFGVGMARSARAKKLFDEIYADYTQSLQGVDDEDKRKRVLEDLHARSAEKCLLLAQENGGIYNKAAQFVASLQGGAGDKGVPMAYVKTLRVLTDRAPFRPFKFMETVLLEDFGQTASQLFADIEESPIAAASLAQEGCGQALVPDSPQRARVGFCCFSVRGGDGRAERIGDREKQREAEKVGKQSEGEEGESEENRRGERGRVGKRGGE